MRLHLGFQMFGEQFLRLSYNFLAPSLHSKGDMMAHLLALLVAIYLPAVQCFVPSSSLPAFQRRHAVSRCAVQSLQATQESDGNGVYSSSSCSLALLASLVLFARAPFPPSAISRGSESKHHGTHAMFLAFVSFSSWSAQVDSAYPYLFDGRLWFRPAIVRVPQNLPDGLSAVGLFGFSIGGVVSLEYDASPVGPYREYVTMGSLVTKRGALGQWGTRLFVRFLIECARANMCMHVAYPIPFRAIHMHQELVGQWLSVCEKKRCSGKDHMYVCYARIDVCIRLRHTRIHRHA